MRQIKEIIIHCSATRRDMNIGRAEIDRWHRERGWECVGYHYIIRRDGMLESGRPEKMIGAHCKGHNAASLGICLVGGVDEKGRPEDNFTQAQFGRLQTLLYDLITRYPDSRIYPHRSFANKDCPCFDLSLYLREIGLRGRDGARDA